MCSSVTSDSVVKPLTTMTSNASAIVKKAQISEINYKIVMLLRSQMVVSLQSNVHVPNATDWG